MKQYPKCGGEIIMKQTDILTYARLWAWGEYEKAQKKLDINPDNKLAQDESKFYMSTVNELKEMFDEELKLKNGVK